MLHCECALTADRGFALTGAHHVRFAAPAGVLGLCVLNGMIPCGYWSFLVSQLCRVQQASPGELVNAVAGSIRVAVDCGACATAAGAFLLDVGWRVCSNVIRSTHAAAVLSNTACGPMSSC